MFGVGRSGDRTRQSGWTPDRCNFTCSGEISPRVVSEGGPPWGIPAQCRYPCDETTKFGVALWVVERPTRWSASRSAGPARTRSGGCNLRRQGCSAVRLGAVPQRPRELNRCDRSARYSRYVNSRPVDDLALSRGSGRPLGVNDQQWPAAATILRSRNTRCCRCHPAGCTDPAPHAGPLVPQVRPGETVVAVRPTIVERVVGRLKHSNNPQSSGETGPHAAASLRWPTSSRDRVRRHTVLIRLVGIRRSGP